MTRRSMTLAAALLAVLVTGTGTAQHEVTPVTDAMLRDPNPADWLMWRRTLDSWGYSPLKEIDRNNVSKLKMTWSRGIIGGRTRNTAAWSDLIRHRLSSNRHPPHLEAAESAAVPKTTADRKRMRS